LRIVVFKLAHGVWRIHGEAASAAALYSVYHGLYSKAVVSSAVSLAGVGHFRKVAQYVQRVAKALYEATKEVFEKVKVAVQRLVELFVEAVTRVLAWIDEHKAYLFLMAAAAARAVELSAALNMWGLVELEKLLHFAIGVPPFVAAGVKVDERRVAEVVRLIEGSLGGALVPGGGIVLAEVERWLAGLERGEVKAAVASAVKELEKWLGAVKGGRYAYHSSGRAARICAGGICAAKTRRWAFYFKPAKLKRSG
jgi:hypothetical protein